ncbi:MAG: DUF1439 domain-containing protein [Ectothiorhodospiraceae bacterium]|nr:DUF1439 domain-containing protein [Ectothiorhodospiraceae bacterium]
MKKRVLAIASATVLLLTSQLAWAFSYTVEISEKELQEKISAMMPLEKKKFFMSVVLSNPDVDLMENDNKIGITIDIKVVAPGGMNGAGRAKITGSLSYNKERGELYFKDPKIVKLDIAKVPKSIIPNIKSLAQSVAGKALEKRPVYKLKDDDVKQKLAKSVLKSITVENGKLLVVLGVF